MRRILITAIALSSALAANTVTPQPAAAADQNRTCKVENVAVLGNRVHVKCDAIPGGGLLKPPVYFAVEIDNPMADKLITLAALALQSGKPLYLTYEGALAGNPAGCRPEDCRRLTSAWLG